MTIDPTKTLMHYLTPTLGEANTIQLLDLPPSYLTSSMVPLDAREQPM